MKKIFFLLIFLTFTFAGFSQTNLVPNCSFEDTISCPTTWNVFSVKDWYQPTGGSIDYFHECALFDVGIPFNALGFQPSKSGKGYAGWATSFDTILSTPNYREYLQIELSSTLISGNQYFISAYFAKADSAPLALKDFGIALSNIPLGGNYDTTINFLPQIVYNQYLTDTSTWSKLSGVIIANGGEKFLTIGYFKNNNSTDTLELFNSNMYNLLTYYFVDDVCVSLDSLKCICDTTSIIAEVNLENLIQINSNILTENVIINLKLPNAHLEIYDLLGRICLSTEIYYGPSEINITHLKKGLFFLKIFDQKKEFVRKILIN